MMTNSISVIASVLLLSSIHCISMAWVIPTEIFKRATAIVSLSTVLVTTNIPTIGDINTNANAATTTSTVNFAGSYSDPNHVNCKRIITIPSSSTPNTAFLSGTDGNPNCPADGSGTPWKLTANIDGNTILVDFSPKGGPNNLKGVFDTNGIKWPDGNKWTLIN